MRILHAGWGFRPWRGGGLISYAEDVMEAQAAAGHEVAYFFGGRRYPGLRRPRTRRWRRRGVRMVEGLGSPIPVGADRRTRFPAVAPPPAGPPAARRGGAVRRRAGAA